MGSVFFYAPCTSKCQRESDDAFTHAHVYHANIECHVIIPIYAISDFENYQLYQFSMLMAFLAIFMARIIRKIRKNKGFGMLYSFINVPKFSGKVRNFYPPKTKMEGKNYAPAQRYLRRIT